MNLKLIDQKDAGLSQYSLDIFEVFNYVISFIDQLINSFTGPEYCWAGIGEEEDMPNQDYYPNTKEDGLMFVCWARSTEKYIKNKIAEAADKMAAEIRDENDAYQMLDKLKELAKAQIMKDAEKMVDQRSDIYITSSERGSTWINYNLNWIRQGLEQAVIKFKSIITKITAEADQRFQDKFYAGQIKTILDDKQVHEVGHVVDEVYKETLDKMSEDQVFDDEKYRSRLISRILENKEIATQDSSLTRELIADVFSGIILNELLAYGKEIGLYKKLKSEETTITSKTEQSRSQKADLLNKKLANQNHERHRP